MLATERRGNSIEEDFISKGGKSRIRNGGRSRICIGRRGEAWRGKAGRVCMI
jgi:hypothetical protein